MVGTGRATDANSTATIGDVAAAAGVSTATVSRVLAGVGHARPETRARVLEAARALDYRPSEVARALKRRSTQTLGLIVTDIEILRLHYAHTLRHWHRRFMANRDEIKSLTDERFCRMWEFYLVGCEMAFRHFKQAVFQFQLTKNLKAVPISRDYIGESERAVAGGKTQAA